MQASEWKFTYISNERSLVSIKSVEYRVLRGPGGGSSNHSNGYSYIELTLFSTIVCKKTNSVPGTLFVLIIQYIFLPEKPISAIYNV